MATITHLPDAPPNKKLFIDLEEHTDVPAVDVVVDIDIDVDIVFVDIDIDIDIDIETPHVDSN
jgi:hypothetical protein